MRGTRLAAVLLRGRSPHVNNLLKDATEETVKRERKTMDGGGDGRMV
ncbi:MAG TPA: hypothetical protein VNI02_11725 [Blastocatellia bacterium]|nr:hypothetical protein [Blastocatellia bacterium]